VLQKEEGEENYEENKKRRIMIAIVI